MRRWSYLDAKAIRVAKCTEPRLTGLAYTARTVYLVACASVATYEQIAKLIHCRALMRDDLDHAKHGGKRVLMLMLCDDCPAAVADFAHRQRVRVVASSIDRAPRLTTTATVGP